MKSQRLNELLSSIENPLNRKPCLEFALAIETAYRLALPTSKVESVVLFFEENHAEVVKRIIGEVNELFPIAVTTCYNLVVDIFRTRYAICHDARILSAEQITAMLSNKTLTTHLTEQHSSVLNNHLHASILRSELSDYVQRYIVDRVAG